MKKRFNISHAAIAAFLACLLPGLTLAADILEGRVVGVHDGDTVTLLMAGNQQVRIRLAQIDAPESSQAFGQRSRQSLSDLVFNKTIQVEKEAVDKYGRTVGTIFVDGLDANREQVRRGMAWVYRQYLHDPSLLQAEEQARHSRLALWSDPNPMPPWEFRRGGKQGRLSHFASPNAESQPANASCAGKRYCKEMASCGEARFYLNQCGLKSLDRDGDGIPCENLCGLHG